MRPDKSEATARAILNRYIQAVRVDFSGSVEAVLLIGSLATGGYVPGPGDIDQITILRQDAAGSAANRLNACIDAAAAAYGGAVHMAPIVHRRSDLERPWPVTWDLRAETRFHATGSACFVKNEIAGRLAGEAPGYLFQTGVDLASRVRVSGSFEVSPNVQDSLTTWCKRFLEWEANHEPDDVPEVSAVHLPRPH